jgi:hypothetical protein
MKYLITLFFVAYSGFLLGQGCSDAGFCTMGAMKPDQSYNRKVEIKLLSMEVSYYQGITTTTPVVNVATTDFNFRITARSSFQIKLPYQWVTQGNLGETQGLSDLSLCYTRYIQKWKGFDLSASVGTKIPTNRSDKVSEKFPNGMLPMYYQTSLGTYDFIAGLSMLNRQWLFATGIQIPLINRNNNSFDWNDFPDYPDPTYLETYGQTNGLQRGIDVMLRVERNFRFSRFNFSAGLLPIYRLTSDQRIDNTNKKIKPEGAQGLALSGIITGGYNFNIRSGIRVLWGHKIVQRDNNPDGLSRDRVTSVTYIHRF